VTKGNMIDQDEIADFVRNVARPKYPRCAEIGFDRWSALPIVGRMRDEGAPMIEVGQGTGGLSAACKLFEALVADRRVVHDGNPVMAFCIANTEIYTDSSGNIKPQKPGGEARGARRIDGVAATVTALARLMQAPEQRSAYSASRGIAFIG
jgi:phage terminase large subunit-like protein